MLIAANPSSLLEVDDQGRTALHTIFFLDKFPSLSIMKTLLTSPGENATKLKDLSVRLPLHIAASRGANEATLRLLVEAYADGCYRVNKEGDLPLHLLVRSGRATTASVELLIRPILDNETICRIQGSQGLELTLHIAIFARISNSDPSEDSKSASTKNPGLLALGAFSDIAGDGVLDKKPLFEVSSTTFVCICVEERACTLSLVKSLSTSLVSC